MNSLKDEKGAISKRALTLSMLLRKFDAVSPI